MNPKNFSLEQLTQTCYTVRRKVPLLPVLALQWMHHTNTRDPIHQQLCSETLKINPLLFFSRISIWIIKSVYWFFGISYLQFQLRREMRLLTSQKFDLLAKSWCFGIRREAGDGDFYYGDLQSQLHRRGLRMLLLCGNATGKSWGSFATVQLCASGLCRVPEFCFVSPWRIFQVMALQVLAGFKLWRLLRRERDALMQRILWRACYDCFSFAPTVNSLYYWIGVKTVSLWKPSFFLTLYEGFAWEKCLWRGIKHAKSDCRIAGYQHTVIFQRTLALRKPCLNREEQSVPDVVLSSGPAAAAILEKGSSTHKTKIIPFGSFRYSSNTMITQPHPQRRAMLVVPEGMLSEAVCLFNMAMEMAGRFLDHQFIFRCHPMLPFQHVLTHLKKNPKAFDNIEISNHSKIEDDFSRSSAVLYRGSSSVLYAILAGLKPFYMHKTEEEIIDPIFDLKEWRSFVDSSDLLEQELKKYSQASENDVLPSWQVAKKYVQDYTMPVDEQSMNRLLESLS